MDFSTGICSYESAAPGLCPDFSPSPFPFPSPFLCLSPHLSPFPSVFLGLVSRSPAVGRDPSPVLCLFLGLCPDPCLFPCPSPSLCLCPSLCPALTSLWGAVCAWILVLGGPGTVGEGCDVSGEWSFSELEETVGCEDWTWRFSCLVPGLSLGRRSEGSTSALVWEETGRREEGGWGCPSERGCTAPALCPGPALLLVLSPAALCRGSPSDRWRNVSAPRLRSLRLCLCLRRVYLHLQTRS